MKVLHVFKTFHPDTFGGVEQMIAQLAASTAPLGVANELVTLSPDPDPPILTDGALDVHRARRAANLFSTGLSAQVFGLFRERARQADLVHYHFPWPLMDIMHLRHARGMPAIATYHSDIVRQAALLPFYRPLMNRFLGGMRFIVATSPGYARSSPVLRRFAERVRVVPIGIADRAPEEAGPPDARLPALPERFFLFVGALRYYKGVTFLAEAARASGLPVVVVGDGELRGRLEAARPANMHLLGAVGDAEKFALIERCTALVLPSHLRSEAFGMALLEAARAGKPMISCEIGTGTSYVNMDGETGLTVPGADAAALAAAMRRIWSEPGTAEAMGRAARARFEAHFRAEDMGRAYLALYRQALGPA